MDKENTVGFQIRLTANMVDRYIKGIHELPDCEHKVTKLQGWIIDFIYKNREEGKDVFQKDIEFEFDIRRSTATELLKLMEKNRMLFRQNVEHDARLKKLILTEAAEEEHKRIIKKIEGIEKIMVKGISKEKMDVFFEVLGDIRNNISLKEEQVNHD